MLYGLKKWLKIDFLLYAKSIKLYKYIKSVKNVTLFTC